MYRTKFGADTFDECLDMVDDSIDLVTEGMGEASSEFGSLRSPFDLIEAQLDAAIESVSGTPVLENLGNPKLMEIESIIASKCNTEEDCDRFYQALVQDSELFKANIRKIRNYAIQVKAGTMNREDANAKIRVCLSELQKGFVSYGVAEMNSGDPDVCDKTIGMMQDTMNCIKHMLDTRKHEVLYAGTTESMTQMEDLIQYGSDPAMELFGNTRFAFHIMTSPSVKKARAQMKSAKLEYRQHRYAKAISLAKGALASYGEAKASSEKLMSHTMMEFGSHAIRETGESKKIVQTSLNSWINSCNAFIIKCEKKLSRV